MRENAPFTAPRSPSPRVAAPGPGVWQPGSLAWIAASALVLAVRFPDWLARPRLWAEDGNVFFRDATRSWLSDVANSYSGYLHLLPRTIAWMGHRVDPALVPALYVYSALAVTLCVVARVFSRRLDLPLKPLLALAVVAAPGTGEVYLSPTNLQWIAALALPLTLFMRDPGRPLDWIVDTVVLLAVGLTGPFCIFALPLFVFRAANRATRASWLLACVVLATSAVQAAVILRSPASGGYPTGPFNAAGFVAVLSSHIPLAFLAGQGWVHSSREWVVILIGLVCFGLLASTLLVDDALRPRRAQLLAFAVILVGFSTAKVRFDLWDYRELFNAERYFYVPRVVALWLALSCLRRLPRPALPWACVAAGALLVLDLRLPSLEEPGYVARPYFDWSPYVAGLRRKDAMKITTSPGWVFTYPNPDRRD